MHGARAGNISLFKLINADSDLQIRDLSRLFPWEVTRIAYNREKHLRRYEKRFIELMQNMVADNGVLISSN